MLYRWQMCGVGALNREDKEGGLYSWNTQEEEDGKKSSWNEKDHLKTGKKQTVCSVELLLCIGMELSIFLLMVACLASCGLVTGGGKKESEWKRLTGLEKGLQDLTKEMKNIKAFCRSAVQPTDGSA